MMSSRAKDLLRYTEGSILFHAVWCFYREKNLFHKIGEMFCLSVFFSILVMNMLAKAPAIFVPMAVLLPVWR